MSSRPSPRTRVGPVRLGIEYQDAVALSLLVDWLGHRQRYARIKSEASDDSGSLDDIRVEMPDGAVELRQVKYAVEPDAGEDEWSWEWLLKRGKRSKASLLAGWAESFHQVASAGGQVAVEIVTNSHPDRNLATCLRAGRVEIEGIADSAVRADIVGQLGSVTSARKFFANCRFRFSEPSLAELYEGACRRFESLGGTPDGWVNLEREIKRWHIQKTDAFRPDGYVTIHTLLRAACWNRLLPRSQEVEVPSDFQLPDKEFHEALVAELSTHPQPCTVVVGAPGVGKSTYTSHLFGELRQRGVPAIRHHYHLSFVKRDVARLDHRAVAESLLHDLYETCAEGLGSMRAHNPKPENLCDDLAEAGNFYVQQGKTLVVLVDGLDHVWRECSPVDELRRLFDLLLPSVTGVPGVALLVATQPVEDEKLPTSLLSAAPRSHWRCLPNLDAIAVQNWLKHHWPEVRPPGSSDADAFHLERAAEALHRRSEGHPLHLRYTVEALKAQGQSATPDTVNALPACIHADITHSTRSFGVRLIRQPGWWPNCLPCARSLGRQTALTPLYIERASVCPTRKPRNVPSSTFWHRRASVCNPSTGRWPSGSKTSRTSQRWRFVSGDRPWIGSRRRRLNASGGRTCGRFRQISVTRSPC